MIITRTPFRISFFGGGTDYPAWYKEEGGAVLSTTIDKYCYITCRFLPPFFPGIKHVIVWRNIEGVDRIADIVHPVVREGLVYLGYDDSQGIEIHYQGDLPSRSGIGSSSSFTVGLLKSLKALKGEDVNNQDLASMAIDLEQNILKENVGSQDQVAATFGGLNVIRFFRDGNFILEPVSITKERKTELESRLLLFFTGKTRTASVIAADVIANLFRNRENLLRMREYVDKALQILGGDGNLDEFGRLLHENWMMKRKQSDFISNSFIDGIYGRAIQAGALGGKLLGAGQAGFVLFYVPAEKQNSVKNALSDLLHVPFQFESEGCSIIHSVTFQTQNPHHK